MKYFDNTKECGELYSKPWCDFHTALLGMTFVKLHKIF